MTMLNWLPELAILGMLFVTLVLINFRVLTVRSIAPVAALSSAIVLGYFAFRPDLAYFESPAKVLHSDALSYFGRLLSLVMFSVFSMGFYFHSELSVRDKQLTTLFTLFLSAFVSLLLQANHLVLFLGAAVGIYFCSTSLILIESGKSQAWVRLIRSRSMIFGSWIAVLSLLVVLSSFLSGSQLLGDWLSGLESYSGTEAGVWLPAILILLGSVILLEALPHPGRAPVGLGVLYFGMHLMIQVFWLRVGVPFFSKAAFLGKQQAQLMIALVFGAFTLRYAYQAVRAKEHHRWFSAALPVLLGLGFFLCLLPADKILPAFFSISLSLLLTVALASHAFLDENYRKKGFITGALIALMGVPPLVLGDQYYRLIHDIVIGGNWVAGVLMIVSWFALVLAVIRMMGTVLLARNGAKELRALQRGEVFFIGLYLLCVIGLTLLRPDLYSLLKEHPLLNLW